MNILWKKDFFTIRIDIHMSYIIVREGVKVGKKVCHLFEMSDIYVVRLVLLYLYIHIFTLK